MWCVNENGPHRHIYLNALSPVSEIVWEGLGNTEMHYILLDFFMRKVEFSYRKTSKQKMKNKKIHSSDM